ncbi:MAG TPA: UbiA family prenyltransferase, partial [Rhodothermales bacterium]|nr:UbiA family prenyltransferase [Rhodothermales bacterium]
MTFSTLRSRWARMLRVPHWAKNTLVLVPLVTAHRLTDPQAVLAASLTFVAFCLLASAGYLLNDLRDVRPDRAHPAKQTRPLAAGEVSPAMALTLAAMLGGAAFAIGVAFLPPSVLPVLSVYLIVTAAYSLGLKRVALLDVLLLAGLYSVRLVAGAVAIEVPMSSWLLSFSTFFFLSLALVKRYAELREAGGSGGPAPEGRGYELSDLPLVGSLGTTSGLIATFVLTLYVASDH